MDRSLVTCVREFQSFIKTNQKKKKITYKNPTFMCILFPVRLVYHPLADKANDIGNAL